MFLLFPYKQNNSEINVGGGEEYGENCEAFDCSNTFINYVGDRCGAFSNPTLRSVSLVEYFYESKWPCSTGCNLCGDGGRMTNGSNNVTYESPFFDNNVTLSCYDLQFDALTGQLAESNYCDVLPPLVEEVCGCIGSPTEPPALPPTTPTISPPTPSPVTFPTNPPSASSSLSATSISLVGAGLVMTLSVLWNL